MIGSGVSIFMMVSAAAAASVSSRDCTVSTDLLREPAWEVRRRFRAEISPSVKGFGRVEQGSDETALSRDSEYLDSCSIWLAQTRGGQILELLEIG